MPLGRASRLARGAVLIATVGLGACVTAPSGPVATAFDATREIERPRSQVINDLVDHFAESRMQIRSIDRSTGVISLEQSRDVSRTFANCGSNPLQPSLDREASVTIFVRDGGRDRSRVTINSDFYEQRSDLISGRSVRVPCFTTGTLEARLFQIAAENAQPAPSAQPIPEAEPTPAVEPEQPTPNGQQPLRLINPPAITDPDASQDRSPRPQIDGPIPLDIR